MKIRKQLEKLRECFAGHYTDKKCLISYEKSSQIIWGGDGDRDEDVNIYLTSDGWLEETIVSEYGEYQKGDGVVERRDRKVSDEYVECTINGDEVSYSNVRKLFSFFEELKEKYPTEMSDW